LVVYTSKMFEAKLASAATLKKIVDAIKDLVTDAPFDCSEGALCLQDKSQEVVVKMMDIDSEHLGIPEQEYSAVVAMPAAEFQKTCRDLAMFSDSLMITVTKAGVVFTGKGDVGSSTVTYAPSRDADDDDQQAIAVEVKEPVTVRLSLSNNVPVVVEYALSEDGYLRFYLAPKIDDDESEMK
uniref:Proliferating cell nuclear antigen n=1 Tax=Gongylonema pulchrum TaxID=637853 RepID=A0A183EI98_9BILA